MFDAMFDKIIGPLFSTEWGRRAGWGVLVVLGLLILLTVIHSFSTWHSDYLISQEPIESASAPGANETLKLIAEIPQWHLFGQKNVVDETAVPVTSMQLRLVGIVKAMPEGTSKVIISEAGQPGKIYEIGDSLSSGVRVHAITADGVILENAGRLEKLPLARPPLLFQGMPKPLLSNQETLQED